jgi:hypothetical protein
MAAVTEIAPDVYRISVYATWANLQFNHFLVKDDEPLLFHAGLRGMFPEVREAVSKLIDPSQLRSISFSHFESDECGALNEWLAVAPHAEVVCSDLGGDGECERFHRPFGAWVRGWRNFFHRQVPVPVLPHPAPATRLGRRRAVRGDWCSRARRVREPAHLGSTIDTEHTDFRPMVTRDGKYLFFSQRRGASWGTATAMTCRVDAKILEQFRR